MPKNDDKKSTRTTEFTEEELSALRSLAQDWLHQQLLLPPFPVPLRTALEKLSIADVEAPDRAATKTGSYVRGKLPAEGTVPAPISPPVRTQ
jgi:hypothetical protein